MFEKLKGCKIKEFSTNEDKTILYIELEDGWILEMKGDNTFLHKAYLENTIDELNCLIGKEIIIADEIEVEYDLWDVLFLYNIETFDDSLQIRFIGEDDAYYASEVRVRWK